MANVTVRDLTSDNWTTAAKLEVTEDQSNFVATNLQSIAWSRYEPSLIPAGIFAGDEMVGFVLYGKEWPLDPTHWGIARFMIDRRHQGKGYGKAAMREMVRLVRESDPRAKGISLSYVPHNEVARKLYASLGFQETGEKWGDETIASLTFEPTIADTNQPSEIAEPAPIPGITVNPLTIETWGDAARLSVRDDQQSFVATNLESLALSRFLPEWIPAGIYAGDTIVGFVFYGQTAEDKWHIMRYMIDQKQQGKGYGKAALKIIIEDILERTPQVKVIDLSVEPDNAVAIHVYETLGFVQTEEFHHGEMVMPLDVENVWKART
jgi:diamine N-acetyltransferase